jgi:hypothetical protein
MRIGRRALLAGAGSALLLPTRLFALQAAPQLDDIVARHVAARGGATALDRVRSCLIELDINERGQTIQGRYAASVDRLVRIDIYAGGNLVYREGVDREGVWLWPGGETAPRPSVATGAANALLHGAENHLFGLHRFAERGHRLRLMPAERIDGRDHHVIEIVYSTGHTSYFYVDPQSWQIVRRRDQRAYHPDADTTQQRVETRYSDFQTISGVVAAHRNVDVDLANGTVMATNQITRRVLNPELPAGLFDRAYIPA